MVKKMFFIGGTIAGTVIAWALIGDLALFGLMLILLVFLKGT